MMNALIAASAAALISSAAFADSPGDGDAHVSLENVEWFDGPLPGVQLAHLWGDDETGARWFFKMEPGVALPMHIHTNDYWGMTIQGAWVHIEGDGSEFRTAPGDYALVKGGEPHADRCDGEIPCIGVLDFAGPRDVALVE
ncbi:MAG TPA: cupin domain-containing protein [Paracoccaceae bacterium]|nr:cupin domain-containing protein [Paracoccaceae bacterium]